MQYPVGANENKRLRALRRLNILDTPPSPGFDRICELARDLLHVPIVLVSMIDRDRQWFKARCGISAKSTPRDLGFCSHTLMSDAMMIVPDATEDERFAAIPLVVGEPFIRFYAGVPLALQPGLRLGTLCVADTEPRRFTAAEAIQFEKLAALALDELRRHRAIRRWRSTLLRERQGRKALREQGLELRRRQAAIAQTERMARVGGWEFDLATSKLSWSDELYRISGLPIGREVTIESALAFYPEQARAELRDALAKMLVSKSSFDLQLPYMPRTGEARWVHIIGEVEVVEDKATRLFGVFQDITERKSAEARMWHLANHDPLTNLPNRALFQDRLEQALHYARRQHSKVGLMLLDLDFFKEVNDTLGHDAGDALLRSVAQRMSATVRDTDTVARLGGDEFAIILTNLVSVDELLPVLNRLQSQLNEPVEFKGETLTCRASIGIAVFPDHDEEAEQLLKDADLALYSAKASGRSRYEMFTSSVREARERRLSVAAQARTALVADQIFPFYQPILALDTGRISGFEALLRWRHPREGIKSPGPILTAFENPDLAFELSDRMVSKILDDMRAWSLDGTRFGRIGFNVSELEFRRGDLAKRFLDRLTEAKIPPSRFVVEVTETVLLSKDITAAQAVLHQLHDAGVLIALDDFGTGHASLSHLNQVPVDIIKIDRSFVRDVPRQCGNAAIVSAVIGLSRSLDIELVAEGIETPEQLRFLQSKSCTRGQGFFFQRPFPAHEMQTFLREWPSRWAAICSTADAA